MAGFYQGTRTGFSRGYMGTSAGGPLTGPSSGNYPANYNTSGGGKYYGKQIDLGPGEYSRLSPASEEMQNYSRYSRYARNVGMTRGIATAASFAVAAAQLGEYAYNMGTTPGQGTYSLPAGWVEQCTGCANPVPTYPCMGEPRMSGKIYSDNASHVPVPINCGYANIYNLFNAPMGTAIAAGATIVIEGWGPTVAPWPDPWATVTRIIGVPAGHPHPGTVPQYIPGARQVIPLAMESPAPPLPEDIEVGRQDTATRSPAGFRVSLQYRFGGPEGPVKTKEPYRDDVPPPRTRERKWKLGKGGPVGDAFGALTEASDALKCAVQAIKANQKVPRRAGHKRWLGAASKHHKGFVADAKYVAENFDVANPDMVKDFLSCMVQNEITDRAVGTLSSKAGKAFGEASGSPRGVGIKRSPPVPTDLLNQGHSWF